MSHTRPTTGASTPLLVSMSSLLAFPDASLEKEFWNRTKSGPLRLVELMSLTLSLGMTLATILLRNPARASESIVMYSSMNGYLHVIITGAVLYLALSRRLLYERYHDWIMIFLRLASYPALILYSDSPCGVIKNVFGRSLIGSGLRDRLSGSVEYSLRALIDVQSCSADEEMPANWLLAVFGAVLAFGPIKLFIDGLRYPLRFRHHVFVQIGAIMVMCIWNKHVCDSCFSENASQACQWTTLSTTGIWLDCKLAGFSMACLTFSLQLHVLMGLLASSCIIYHQEVALRMGRSMRLWPSQ